MEGEVGREGRGFLCKRQKVIYDLFSLYPRGYGLYRELMAIRERSDTVKGEK